jgi:Putative restriction endonuclease
MTMSDGEELRYHRPPVPLVFPTGAEVPETKHHLKLRTLLYQFLDLAFADQAAIGCDQFVYWDPTDPRACLAPDAFVRWGQPDFMFRSWKTWEHGAPDIAVEVISDADERDRDWEAKLNRYRRLGVRELVRFDPESPERKLRIWDLVEHDLVERLLDGAPARSRCLPGYWLLLSDVTLGTTLRLSRDALGTQLYPTPAEAGAERVRELEAELLRRG